MTGEFFPGGVLADGVTIGDIDFGFDVNFATGAITNGFLALFDGPLPDLGEAQSPSEGAEFPQQLVTAFFSGQVVGSGGVNGAEIDILGGGFSSRGPDGIVSGPDGIVSGIVSGVDGIDSIEGEISSPAGFPRSQNSRSVASLLARRRPCGCVPADRFYEW